MTYVDKKKGERDLLEAARALTSEFPDEAPVEGERPDFRWPMHGLGLDVTSIRQPRRGKGFAPAAVESFRTDVARAAKSHYIVAGNGAVDVTLVIADENGKQSADVLGQRIAKFVDNHFPDDGRTRTYGFGNLDMPLPKGVTKIVISPSYPGRAPLWQSLHPGETVLLTRELLAASLSSKEFKVSGYRKKASRVWLLIGCGIFPGSTSIIVPDAVEEWRFVYSFDRVLLFSKQDQKVWRIAQA